MSQIESNIILTVARPVGIFLMGATVAAVLLLIIDPKTHGEPAEAGDPPTWGNADLTPLVILVGSFVFVVGLFIYSLSTILAKMARNSPAAAAIIPVVAIATIYTQYQNKPK